MNENEITGINYGTDGTIIGVYINKSHYISSLRFVDWEKDEAKTKWPDNFYEPKIWKLKSIEQIKSEFYHREIKLTIIFPIELNMPNINPSMIDNFGKSFMDKCFSERLYSKDRKFITDSFYDLRWFEE